MSDKDKKVLSRWERIAEHIFQIKSVTARLEGKPPPIRKLFVDEESDEEPEKQLDEQPDNAFSITPDSKGTSEKKTEEKPEEKNDTKNVPENTQTEDFNAEYEARKARAEAYHETTTVECKGETYTVTSRLAVYVHGEHCRLIEVSAPHAELGFVVGGGFISDAELRSGHDLVVSMVPDTGSEWQDYRVGLNALGNWGYDGSDYGHAKEYEYSDD
jgi:hypothetical protein